VQQSVSEEEQRKRVQNALDEAKRIWMEDQKVFVNNAINEAVRDARDEIKVRMSKTCVLTIWCWTSFIGD